VEISLQSHTYVLLNLLSLYVVCWHLWMHKMGGLCHGKEILSIRGYISWLTHVCLKLKSSSIIVFLFEANGTSHGVRSVCVILLCICTSPVLFSLRGQHFQAVASVCQRGMYDQVFKPTRWKFHIWTLLSTIRIFEVGGLWG
jgi:hypothetical protein